MTKGEKGIGETLKRVAKECRNDTIRTQMNKIKKEFLSKHIYIVCTDTAAMKIFTATLYLNYSTSL